MSGRAANLIAVFLAVAVWIGVGGAFMAQEAPEAVTSATADRAADLRASAAADRAYAATRQKSADALRALAASARASGQSGSADERASWLALAAEREASAAGIDAEVVRLLQRASDKEVRARTLAASGSEPAEDTEQVEGAVKVLPEDRVTATEVDGAAATEAPLIRMSAYMKRCKENGVPLPPKWGSGWQKQGDLPTSRLFASDEPITEVWTFTDPLGICFALPRKNSSGEIQLLGIICQGTASGKACFWDNIDRASKKEILGIRTLGMDPADIQDGDSLDQNCTDCHRGDNAFFIHPDTVLNQDGIMPDRDYEPVSTNPAWVNEPRSQASDFEQCETCHTIPKLTAKYCEMAKRLIGKTMPPDENWRENHSDAVNNIAAECNALTPALKWNPERDNP